VTAVFTGKERVFNRRFLIMTDHYMVEPTACSPAAGWEKVSSVVQFSAKVGFENSLVGGPFISFCRG
jgi:hypothetical protein